MVIDRMDGCIMGRGLIWYSAHYVSNMMRLVLPPVEIQWASSGLSVRFLNKLIGLTILESKHVNANSFKFDIILRMVSHFMSVSVKSGGGQFSLLSF